MRLTSRMQLHKAGVAKGTRSVRQRSHRAIMLLSAVI